MRASRLLFPRQARASHAQTVRLDHVAQLSFGSLVFLSLTNSTPIIIRCRERLHEYAYLDSLEHPVHITYLGRVARYDSSSSSIVRQRSRA